MSGSGAHLVTPVFFTADGLRSSPTLPPVFQFFSMKFICFLNLTFPKTMPKANDRFPFRLEQSASFQRRWLLVLGREGIYICLISSKKSHQPPTPNSSIFGINHRPFHLTLPYQNSAPNNFSTKFPTPKMPTKIFFPKKTSHHKKPFQTWFFFQKKNNLFVAPPWCGKGITASDLGFVHVFFHSKNLFDRKKWGETLPAYDSVIPLPVQKVLKIWEWYGNSMGPPYHKGGPMSLGGPM